MPDFNPDEYLAGKQPEQKQFDPDTYLGGTQEPKKDLSWSEVPGQAFSNIPKSAVEFGKAIAQPFMHPIETAGNLAALGSGVIQHLGLGRADPGETEDKDAATAAGKFLMDRYGSAENIKRSIAEDPVGVAADLSSVLTGGGGLAARAPGIAGRVGEVAATAGRAIDPLRAAGTAASYPLGWAGKAAAGTLGTSTGAGARAVREAEAAGFAGGTKGEAFREAMRGEVPVADIVEDARQAVRNMREERGIAYRKDIAPIMNDPKILDFDKVDQAMANVVNVKQFKGVPISPKTAAVRNEIGDIIEAWRGYAPAQYHTAAGFDALKQTIGDIKDSLPFNTPQRKVANEAYAALRRTITDQAPAYAKVMKGYERASDLIEDMERSLSINPKASVDTTLRKLQSVMRNNVTAMYGKRAELAGILTKAGATNLIPKLAGQTLSSWHPRGLSSLATKEAVIAALGGLGAGLPGAAAAMAASIPAAMPRLVGEGAYKLGQARRFGRRIPSAIAEYGLPGYQIGRIPTIENPQGFKKGGRVTRTFRVKA